MSDSNSPDRTANASQRPPAHSGLRHVALFVANLEDCAAFYVDLLGMTIEWQPDADNLFLTSGNDNLALHRRTPGDPPEDTRLDHIGFILDDIDDVDRWHQWLGQHQVTMTAAPKTHRDGARSFYCEDPAGTSVQLIYHPPLSVS